MTTRLDRAGLSVAPALAKFVEGQALPGTGVTAEHFWTGLATLYARFAPENAALLAERDAIQARIDARYRAGEDGADPGFLREIGYLVAEPAPFTIDPQNVDPEVATIAAPQLVVPALNARFLLNAANARWGSLYDALYGTDAIPGTAAASGYDAGRGAQVIEWARTFLDEAIPLAAGSWRDWRGEAPDLAPPARVAGRTENGGWLIAHHGLHVELVIDRDHPIGRDDPAALADVVLEAAATTIVDLEDSVAAVDAEDKVAGFANWLGLMRGDLTARFAKGGRTVTRALEEDRRYRSGEGQAMTLPGRSLLFLRTVGHLMTTPAIRLPDGAEAPEGILDTAIGCLIALHDRNGARANSRAGSIYLVKPKMHGPAECAFTDRLFDAVEDLLGLPRHTVKVGLMDEERRTSANLSACIHALRHRIVFINTGFLDRTGDEIHTAMHAGPMIPKAAMKGAGWIAAYEDRNVAIGLASGFGGRAQIGKGMWAMPDRMADMLAQKIAHPETGATTAWVPSPTAATLHATHYHRVDVHTRQAARGGRPPAALAALLTPPVAPAADWTPDVIGRELDNNAQGILGYVVRWVDQGVGCSKVPDIHDVGLMEDRATLRISSQHMANWRLHGIAPDAAIHAAFRRMAARVDAQNAGDPAYRPLIDADGGESLAYRAALALVMEGVTQPSGYTEPLLHRFRQQAKAADGVAPPAATATPPVSQPEPQPA